MDYFIWMTRNEDNRLVRLNSGTREGGIRTFQILREAGALEEMKDAALVDEDGVVIEEVSTKETVQ